MRIVRMRGRWLTTLSLLSLPAMIIVCSAWSTVTAPAPLSALAAGNIPGTVSRAEGSGTAPGRTRIRALAPVEVVASGFEALAGVAIEASGAILVTDRQAGTLTRIDPAGRRHVLLEGLHKPPGVAVQPDGAILLIEQGGRRLLHLAVDGVVRTVTSTVRQARAVAVGPDGRVWVSTRRAVGRDRDDDDDEDDHRGSEYVIARLDESWTLTPVASGFMDVQGIAADSGALYVAVGRLAPERGRSRTTLARVPIRANGSAGPVESLTRNTPDRPRGVTIDVAGGVFVGGTASEDDERAGVIVKWQADGRVSTFATGVRDPVALALAPNGDLLVVEKDTPGRVLRFRAPPPPELAAHAFTNQAPLVLDGRAAAGARVTVLQAGGSPLAFTVGDATTGAFSLGVPLEPNATNSLEAVATGAAGAGLVGPPAAIRIVHDDVPPALTIVEPLMGLHVRRQIPASARAKDERSGLAALLWSVDGTSMVHLENPTPEEPFAATTTLLTETLSEGPHTIDIAAVDRAGNRTFASIPIVVDRTPPETVISSSPAARVAATTATFIVSGIDTRSTVEQLDYAWRLDGAPWSIFDGVAVVTLSGLAPGEHRFEVKARDRAGNEDATPAIQTFTVTALQVRILEPAPGTVVATESVWVRGVVESGTGEITVSMSLPSHFGVDAVMAPVEGGTFALEVPADPTLTMLTLIATDAAGLTAQADVSIVVAPERTLEPRLDLWPPGGLTPLSVRMGLRGWTEARVTIDVEGDGLIEYDGVAETDERWFTYERPGIYVPTVRITTSEGEVLTRRGAVEVYDRAVLDTRLQAVWRGFKDALRNGNVEDAVSFIATERQPAWTEYFQQVPSGVFADVDRLFTTITLVEVGYGGAQYEMVAERDGLLYSYAVWFRIDADGRWRLWRF